MTTMTMQNEDGTTTDMIGLIALDGVAIPRSEVAKIVPDMDRFEAWCEVAEATREWMDANPGQVPANMDRMDDDDCDALISTMEELGNVYAGLSNYFHQELANRK